MHVGSENRDAHDAFPEFHEFRKGKQDPGRRNTDRHNHEKRWKDTPRPSLVKITDAEAPSFKVGQQNGGNQEATDNEEYIHSNEATTEPWEACVEQDHR